MADYDSGLPIRTEADGTDERLHCKIVDESTPSQMATVDTDKNLHIENHGNKPDTSDVVMRLSELGAINSDGDYDGTNNTKPSNTGIIVHDRNATPNETHQNVRVTGVTGSEETTHHCMDVSLHDELGNAYDDSNPLPVTFEESEGDEIFNHHAAASVAKDASADHDYSVADGDIFHIGKLWVSGSGKIKIEVKIGDGAASEVFTTIFTGFNSTANPNIPIDLCNIRKKVTGTANTTTIRITKTNRDNQPQDIFSTIVGIEK